MNKIGTAIRCLVILLAATLSSASPAASILVNTLDDEFINDGDCSFREAIESANNNTSVDDCNRGDAGADTITLLVSGTMTLDMGELPVTEALEVLGTGIDNLSINAGPGSRHFHIDMPANTHDFSISFLTLSRGDANGHGGSILVEQVGTLKLDSVMISGNAATSTNQSHGGAIALVLPTDNDSRLEVHDTVLESNTAGYRGGAIHIEGGSGSSAVETIDIQRSLFRDNLANGSGGAIYAIGVPTIVISDSTFEGNEADQSFSAGEGAFGGAIYSRVSDLINPFMQIDRSSFIDNSTVSAGGALHLSGGTTAVVNSTFAGNHISTFGGDGEAFNLVSGADLALFNSTLTNNGVQHFADSTINICDECSLTLTHSIVWSDWNPTIDCETHQFGVVTSNGYNIDGSGTCTGHANDLPSTDPQLWLLGDYGDNTTGIVIPTRLPRSDGAAIDAGDTSCPGTFGVPLTMDQRGEDRPVAGPGATTARCDIGATEYQPGSDPVARSLTVSLAGNSTGQVISDPSGINCPGLDCTAEFPGGTTVELTALTGPKPGIAFAGWSGDCSGTGSCLLTLDGDKSVTATFNTITDEIFADRFEDSP